MQSSTVGPQPAGLQPVGLKPALIFQERWIGEGLEWLESHDAQTCAESVILTENPCPEYAQDLLEYKPAGLIVCTNSQVNTARGRAVPQLLRRQSVFDHAKIQSRLLPSERAILRYLSRNFDTREIAGILGISHKTVRNRVSEIGQKLGLENRLQVVLYYTGQWQWLAAYRDAFEVFCGPRRP